MTEEIKNELAELTSLIAKSVDLTSLYLFGSYAYGTPTEDSDFDIYMVIPDGSIRPLDAMTRAGIAIARAQKRPIDLLAGRKTEFENRRRSVGFIEKEVFEKGVKLYG